jgi:exodeoxyribonuclease V alpha subunit
MKSDPEPSTQEVLAGLVERVTFHNAENGFCVLRAKARGHRDLVTVVGHGLCEDFLLALIHQRAR